MPSPWVTRALANDLPGQAYAGTAAAERAAEKDGWVCYVHYVKMQDWQECPACVRDLEAELEAKHGEPVCGISLPEHD